MLKARYPLVSLLAVFAVVVEAIVVQVPAVEAQEEPAFQFVGGGYGHGVGMSQYGSRGRAEAGFSYTEILNFYYPNTQVAAAPELLSDDVDVLIAVHSTTTFTPTGMLTVAMDGSFLDTTVNRLRVSRGDGGWYINSSNIDWCRGFCKGTVLTVSFNEGEPVRVSSTSNNTQRYARGQFQLTPASTGARNCGSSNADHYCLVVGDLSMQHYLYGVAEMSSGWHTEALKVQAIAARSYAAAKISERTSWGEPFDIYGTHKDQQYRGWDKESENAALRNWPNAVDDTKDVVVLYTPEPENPEEENTNPQPRVATTFYSASNGGHVASSEEPWHTALPYLEAKPDTYDAVFDENGEPQNPFYQWFRTYTHSQVSRWLTEYDNADLDVGSISDIRIENAGPSGRIDDALVTLVGSKRTLEVRRVNSGTPYGYRFYYALLRGCRATPGCKPMLSTKIVLADGTLDIPDDDTNYDDTNYDELPASDELAEFSHLTRFNPHYLADEKHLLTKYSIHSLPFSDVHYDSPYGPAVVWMLNSGITTGTTDTTFSPEDTVTRVQFATWLWRFAGKIEFEDKTNNFIDLEGYGDTTETDTDNPLSDFQKAVTWMTENLITNGCEADRFCPHKPLTAAQIAAFLWRFAGSTPSSGEPIIFVDAEANSYYLEPLRWMLRWDLWVNENFESPSHKDFYFHPYSPVSRAQVAVYLWNLAGQPDAFTPARYLPPFML